VVGFEPQPDALNSLNQQKGSLETYLPYALGDGFEHTLYLCRESGMSSLLRPNSRTLKCFNLFSEFGRVVDLQIVQTRRLDDVAEIEVLDLMKIDVQGSELSVFRGGSRKLHDAVAVQTEVSFVPLYENQPTFGDVDQELRHQGFIPHAFTDIKRWPIAPFALSHNPRCGLNQLLEADVVYVRDFTYPDSLSAEQLKHLAIIAHYCFGSFDLALHCLLSLKDRSLVSGVAVNSYRSLVNAGN